MANGIQSEPVYVLADANMNAEEFRYYKVNGLGTGTQVDNFGYIVIVLALFIALVFVITT